MDDFNTIRLKKKTIDKFKKYSKKTSPSYSETLDFMIAFFEDNNLSPYDTLKPTHASLTNILNKRMDAIVSVLRNVEETQLKPTKKLLESLFEEMETKPDPVDEDFGFGTPKLITENEELIYYREASLKYNEKLTQIRYRLGDVLKNMRLVKNTLGANHYSLKLTIEQYNAIKEKLEEDAL